MLAHFVIPKSILVHSQYLHSLFSWSGSDVSLFSWGDSDISLFVIIARSSAYVAIFIIILDVPSV